MNIRPGLAIAGLLFLSFVVSGCSSSNEPLAAQTTEKAPVDVSRSTAPTTPAPIQPLYATDDAAAKKEWERRVVYKRQFMNAAKELVVKANSQKHADVYNFVSRHGMLALPTIENCVMVEGPAKDPFAVVVVLPEDAQLGPPWSNVFTTAGAMAVYGPDEKTIFLSPVLSGSPEGMGLSLLHEGFHAWEHLVNKRPQAKKGDAEAFCLGEIEAHEFMAELTAKIHPAYDTLINDISSKIGGSEQDGIITVRSNGALRQEIDNRLAGAFGRTIPNVSEHRAMNVDVWYLANFRHIEKTLPKSDWKTEKVRFLKEYLEQTGNAQWLKGR